MDCDEPVNGALCVHCGSVIVSLHRHDFQSCVCERDRAISVDGGKSYKRRIHGKSADWIEIDSQEELLIATQLAIEVSNGPSSVQS